MLRLITIALAVVVAVSCVPTKPSSGPGRPPFCTSECPDYEVLCSKDEYEIRRYPEGTWVATHEQGITQTAASARAFWRLFTYLQGKNDQETKIPMTAPVLVEVSKKQTSWVLKDYVVSFYLPKIFWEFVPNPLDDKVFIQKTKDFTVFVHSYGGLANDPIPGQQVSKLRSILDKHNETYYDGFYYSAGYDKPSKVTNRHNEVWLVLPENTTYTCESTKQDLDQATTVTESQEITVDVEDNSDSLDQCERSECPSHLTLGTYANGIEKRRYGEGVYITKEIESCWYELASAEGFWALFRYINGKNDRKEKIPMTAPVIMSIDMTPKEFSFCRVSFKMSFFIPTKFHSNPPRPLEDKVKIERARSRTVYVKTFGGWATNSDIKRMRQGFTNELETLGACYDENLYLVAAYDAPTKLFNRRNELWVDVCEDNELPSATVEATSSGKHDTQVPVKESKEQSETISPTPTTSESEGFTDGKGKGDIEPVDPGSFRVCTDRNVECPEFELVGSREDDVIQERHYRQSYWISKTLQACDINEAQMVASRSLVNYKNGMNSVEANIATTAPILTAVDTSTMDENDCNITYTVSFYISHKYQDNPPQPIEDGLFISAIDTAVFVKSFQTWPTFAKSQNIAKDIEDALVDDETCQSITSDVYYVAGYDRPFSSIEPYSEVWIPKRFCFEDDLSNVRRKLLKLKKERVFADPIFDGLEFKPPRCTDGDAECANYLLDSVEIHYERRTYQGEHHECFVQTRGADYRGDVSTTVYGIPCQKWSEQDPHEHGRDPDSFPNSGLGDHNYCRNPDGEPRPWCYTTDPDTRWDYCNISRPGEYCGVKLACVSNEACNYQGAKRQDYYSLHRYLSAEGNKQNVDIEKVLPVIRQIRFSDLGESSCGKSYTTCFYLPKEFQSDPPEPIDPKVSIEEMPPTSFYVSAIGGHITEDVLEREIYNVQLHVEDDNPDFQLSDLVVTASYNNPSREEDRYTEVWLPIPRD